MARRRSVDRLSDDALHGRLAQPVRGPRSRAQVGDVAVPAGHEVSGGLFDARLVVRPDGPRGQPLRGRERGRHGRAATTTMGTAPARDLASSGSSTLDARQMPSVARSMKTVIARRSSSGTSWADTMMTL